MRQSLIVGARPMFVKGRQFPRVPLEKGSWKIESENVNESKIRLTIYTPTPVDGGVMMIPKVVEMPPLPDAFLVLGPVEISAEIVHAGREAHVSLFAYPQGQE